MNISDSTGRKKIKEEMNEKNESIQFTVEVNDSFKQTLKRGIYKELFHKNLLTNEQLNSLLSK